MSISLLTFALRSLILNSPNRDSRNRRLSRAPHGEKVLSAICIFRASYRRRVHIGRPTTSSIREDWRFRFDRGVLYGLPFFLIPKQNEVLYVSFSR